ncbi:MAG: hypothetical protein FJW40_00735 [Acidobacteria bacterium]|nr:hypothetical protein [Acidobacteriota bacterium]
MPRVTVTTGAAGRRDSERDAGADLHRAWSGVSVLAQNAAKAIASTPCCRNALRGLLPTVPNVGASAVTLTDSTARCTSSETFRSRVCPVVSTTLIVETRNPLASTCGS